MSFSHSEDLYRWEKGGAKSRRIHLFQRQQIVSAIREYFYQEGFLEAEIPLLLKSTCPDPHIDSISAGLGYLTTSTEYQIKRMMVGGFEKIFTLTKNFRANDRGRYHSEEFTMLEWARAGAPLSTIINDLVYFIKKAFSKLYPNETKLTFQGVEIDILEKPWETLSVRVAFDLYLGLTNLDDFSLNRLLNASKKADIQLPIEFQEDRFLVISYLLDLLQTKLGQKTPTLLKDWPVFLATTAPLNKNDPYTADRCELYIGGIEIANGFPFLRDAQLQKKLFEENLELRKELSKPSVHIDERYLETLPGLPEGAGMALGVDRLVMVLTGAQCLKDVQAFDWDEL